MFFRALFTTLDGKITVRDCVTKFPASDGKYLMAELLNEEDIGAFIKELNGGSVTVPATGAQKKRKYGGPDGKRLSSKKVAHIRYLTTKYPVPDGKTETEHYSAIAKPYGVSLETVRKIAKHKTWPRIRAKQDPQMMDMAQILSK